MDPLQSDRCVRAALAGQVQQHGPQSLLHICTDSRCKPAAVLWGLANAKGLRGLLLLISRRSVQMPLVQPYSRAAKLRVLW